MRKLAGNSAKHQTTYLVDMARIEGLDAMGENRKAVELIDRPVRPQYGDTTRFGPQHADAYYNRAIAYTLLRMDAEAQQDIEAARSGSGDSL